MKSCVFGSIFTLLINMFYRGALTLTTLSAVTRGQWQWAVVLSTPATSPVFRSRQTISSLLHISTVPTTFNLDQNLSAIGLLVFKNILCIFLHFSSWLYQSEIGISSKSQEDQFKEIKWCVGVGTRAGRLPGSWITTTKYFSPFLHSRLNPTLDPQS